MMAPGAWWRGELFTHLYSTMAAANKDSLEGAQEAAKESYLKYN